MLALDLVQRLDAIQSRHRVVEKRDVELAGGDPRERADALLRLRDLERKPRPGQKLAHDGAGDGGVVDDEDAAAKLQPDTAVDQDLRLLEALRPRDQAVRRKRRDPAAAEVPAVGHDQNDEGWRRLRGLRRGDERRQFGQGRGRIEKCHVDIVGREQTARGSSAVRFDHVDRNRRRGGPLPQHFAVLRGAEQGQYPHGNEVTAHTL